LSQAQPLPNEICVAKGSSQVTCTGFTFNFGASQGQVNLLNKKLAELKSAQGLSDAELAAVGKRLQEFEGTVQSALHEYDSAQGSLFQRDEEISRDIEKILSSLVALAARQTKSESSIADQDKELAELRRKLEELEARLGRVTRLKYSPQRLGIVPAAGVRIEGEAIGFGARSQPLTVRPAFGLGLQVPLGRNGWTLTAEGTLVLCPGVDATLHVVSGDPDEAVLARTSATLKGYALGFALAAGKEWAFFGVGGRMGVRFRDIKWQYEESSLSPDNNNHSELEAAIELRLRFYEGVSLSVLPGLILAPNYQPTELVMDPGGMNPTLARRELAVYPIGEARLRWAFSWGKE